MALSLELKAMNDMNESGLEAKGFRYYEQFKALDDMNDFGS